MVLGPEIGVGGRAANGFDVSVKLCTDTREDRSKIGSWIDILFDIWDTLVFSVPCERQSTHLLTLVSL